MIPPGDRRILPARPDLADRRLHGRLRASAFAEARPFRCRAPFAAIRKAADLRAEQENQLLYGEVFEVLEESREWAWGQARRDGYVGYVALAALGPFEGLPTHRIKALRTFGFEKPERKSYFLGPYSLNALVRAQGGRRNGFLDCGGAGWIFEAHLAPVGMFESDPAAVAERHLGTPYLWGGRDSQGLDCSGLVQQAFYACGRACPRDADQQLAFFTAEAPRDGLKRGDLVFWSDHVAMMLDRERLIHANGRHMAVAVEGLAEAITQIGAEPVALRRP
jgi:hypothetical protein